MEKLQIIKRYYNGDYGVGSIFEDILSFTFNQTLCNAHIHKSFCCNEDLGSDNLSTVDIEVPFTLSEDSIIKLNNVLKKIENSNDYLPSENHYKYNYIEIIIDNHKYELSSDSKILLEIENILLIKKIDSICNATIESIMEADING